MNILSFDTALAWDSLPAMLAGLRTTVLLTVCVLALGLVLSVLLTLARMSASRLIAWPAIGFVVFFRGAPLLILLYLVYYGLGQIGAVRQSPLWFVFGSPIACAIIALTLNHVAYMVEVVRGAIEAIPRGLTEAAAALGIPQRKIFINISLPLALRYGLKAYQNEVVGLTKGTAVVGAVTLMDLTATASGIFEMTYDPFTPILMAAAFYWALVNLIRCGFGWLDTRLNRHLAVVETPKRSRGRS